MAYELPPLPYPFDALEPYIDAKTMQFHHDNHHATYVTNVNKALEGNPLGNEPIEKVLAKIESVPENIRAVVRNHGGGHANHSLFWTIMGPKKGGEPVGKLADAIKAELGGFEPLKMQLSAAAMGRFGSGWGWLVVDKQGRLVIESSPNQDSPLMNGSTPILGLDVWEHAYYLKYQYKRADYVAAFFNVIDWDAVNRRFEAAKK